MFLTIARHQEVVSRRHETEMKPNSLPDVFETSGATKTLEKQLFGETILEKLRITATFLGAYCIAPTRSNTPQLTMFAVGKKRYGIATFENLKQAPSLDSYALLVFAKMLLFFHTFC